LAWARKRPTRDVGGLGFQFVERGQGNAVSAIEVAENIKDLSFKLVVRTAPQAEPLSNKKWGWRNVASPGVFPPRRFIV
jgi:hypothetical protein